MSEPYLAEIRISAGNFAPRGWAFCDGQLLPVAENTALFSLLGTTYGGDGRTTFALPDLKGRSPMHPGRGPGLAARRLGEKVGTETVTLTEAEIPSHTHTARAATVPALPGPATNTSSLARSAPGNVYQSTATADLVDLASETLSTTGGGQAHTNLQPFLALNFIIALVGLYPSRG